MPERERIPWPGGANLANFPLSGLNLIESPGSYGFLI